VCERRCLEEGDGANSQETDGGNNQVGDGGNTIVIETPNNGILGQ